MEAELRALGPLMEKAAAREAIEAGRPAGCTCLGVGGTGRIVVTIDGVPIMEDFCEACPEGATLARIAEGYTVSYAAQELMEDRARAVAEKQARVQERLVVAGVPEKLRGCDFPSYREVAAPMGPLVMAMVSYLERLFDDPALAGRYARMPDGFNVARTFPPCPKGVYLWGAAGHGKTSLLVALTRAWVYHERAAVWYSAPDLMDALRASYGKQGTESADLWYRVQNAPLLVLDDLGTQQGTEHERAKLLALIHHRHALGDQVVTLMSSNYELQVTAEMLAGGVKGENTEEVSRFIGRVYEMTQELHLQHRDLR